MDIKWHDADAVLSDLGQHIGMWRWEFATDRVQWSDYLLEILGIDRADFVEHFDFFEEQLHPDDRGLVRSRIEEHLSTGSPYLFRCRLRHAHGHHLTVLAQGSSRQDESGKTVELAGTVTDVSNEARIASELVESERSFQSLAENVPGAIFRYILREDGSDEIEYMSSGCYDIWELTAEEIEGDPSALWAVVFEEDLPAMKASVMDSAAKLSPWYCKWRIHTPVGGVKHLEGRGTPSRQPDGSVLWNSLILDVSREAAIRKELLSQQEMLGRSQRMESIGRISGGIAHDFNNLLAIIMGNAQILEEAETEEELMQCVAEIIDASQRGSRLTRHLLSFARQSTLEPVLVDVDRSIKNISTLVSRVIPESILVDTVRTAGLWKAELDVSFLENAILNLSINARDAMPNGGKLTIETSNVRITSEYADSHSKDIEPGRYVLVAVTDTGSGIPASEISKVTEPFYSTKGPDVGSGLGLAMVDGFVRQSNGALRIYSELGSGTTVKLYLPAIMPENELEKASPTPISTGMPTAAKGRILVVEDEESILNVVSLTLRRAGYEVSAASRGDDAVAQFGETIESFDLLLTDVVMPGKFQGPALATELTSRAPKLQVIFMSGHPNEAAVHGNGVRATDKFLMKPVMRQKLLSVIEEVLRK